MTRICYLCGKILGEKEPLADKSVTHGLCDEPCLRLEMEQLGMEYEFLKRIERVIGPLGSK